ncbi:MAG: GIY-YIG nuclease family protein [Patescibacteria group bacterium]
MDRQYCVYILANKPRTVLYIGMTGNIANRIAQHKVAAIDCFSSKYKTYDLVYCEAYPTPLEAILREKQLKRWSRSKKEWLIRSVNPEMKVFEI